MTIRRTKIIATLGPATDQPGVLAGLFKAGVDVVRLNFSHGDTPMHIERARTVKALSQSTKRPVGILADLQGPKVRIARFKEGKVFLKEGQDFALDIELEQNAGDTTQVGITYRPLARDVKPGNILLLDDGRVVMEVVKTDSKRVECKVTVGGELSNNKGINLLGGGLSAEALTEKDRADIKTAVQMNADYIAVSFPRTADDIYLARRLVREAGGRAGIVAKIERAEALDVIEDIIQASDAIMVARGDLGVEIGDANLPAVQKDLINLARSMDRVVITATQMMESMIQNPLPTRAEVFDVANAVIDGTDAVMLSAETAIGRYPIKTVEAMNRVCLETEKQPSVRVSGHRINQQFERIDEAVAMASMYLANHTEIKLIVALTESGSTPLWLSRISSGTPIFAFTSHPETCGRVTLYRGVFPQLFKTDLSDHVAVNREIVSKLRTYGLIESGDKIIITKGDLNGVPGGTNAMKVITLDEGLTP